MRLITSILLLCTGAVQAAEPLPRPIPAEVVRVLDGDTIEVEARIWLGQSVRTLIRIEGIDAPELKGRCAAERAAAERARRFAEARLAGRTVGLHDVAFDKYGGRAVARVSAAGEDIGAALLRAGLVRSYAGKRKGAWCEA